MFQPGDFQDSFDEAGQFSPAFGPDELQVGSIVFGHMQRALGKDYHKDIDDSRPMLVTGLWRRGEAIEKIELANFTTTLRDTVYPDDLAVDLAQAVGPGTRSHTRLKMADLCIFENSSYIFPYQDNPEEIHMKDDLWPNILACRAQSILYNSAMILQGSVDFSLVREGFVFPTISLPSIRGTGFVPEVETHRFTSRPSQIIPQEHVNEIVSFAVNYTECMHKMNGHSHFTFPQYEDWPVDVPKAAMPKWWDEAEPAPPQP